MSALHDRIACPVCRTSLDTEFSQKSCTGCGLRLQVEGGNVAVWGKPNLKAHRLSLTDKLRAAIDPLVNPYSPIVRYARKRIEKYYVDVLNSPILAERFRVDYLGGLDLPKDAAILDHGGGRGRISALLRQLGYTVCCQDTYRHPWWSKLPDVGFQVTAPEIHTLPWRDSVFDAVMDFSVLGYIPGAALPQFAQEVARVLRPGGSWVVWELNARTPGASASGQFLTHIYEPSEIVEAARSAGFDLVDLHFEGSSTRFAPRFAHYVNRVLLAKEFDYQEYARSNPRDALGRMALLRFKLPAKETPRQ